MTRQNAITDVPGILVGHYSNSATGTTVILIEGEGAVGGVDVRGEAPGTRERQTSCVPSKFQCLWE